MTGNRFAKNANRIPPRTQVQEIIGQLYIEENLSHSKIVGILFKEAFTARGLFDQTQGQAFESNPNWKA